MLSAIFVGLFVAESSGSVLSANILSDTVALVKSPDCCVTTADRRVDLYHSSLAGRYAETCCQSGSDRDECKIFYNQSITYTEKGKTPCPFAERTCAQEKGSGYTLDTGYVHAKCWTECSKKVPIQKTGYLRSFDGRWRKDKNKQDGLDKDPSIL